MAKTIAMAQLVKMSNKPDAANLRAKLQLLEEGQDPVGICTLIGGKHVD